MARTATNMLFGSDRYSTGLAASFTNEKRRRTRARGRVPGSADSIRPASRPQHSLGNSARAWASISSYKARGNTRQNGVDNIPYPPEDNTFPPCCNCQFLVVHCPFFTDFEGWTITN